LNFCLLVLVSQGIFPALHESLSPPWMWCFALYVYTSFRILMLRIAFSFREDILSFFCGAHLPLWTFSVAGQVRTPTKAEIFVMCRFSAVCDAPMLGAFFFPSQVRPFFCVLFFVHGFFLNLLGVPHPPPGDGHGTFCVFPTYWSF